IRWRPVRRGPDEAARKPDDEDRRHDPRDRQGHAPRRGRPRGRGPGLPLLLHPRAHPHPDEPPHARTDRHADARRGIPAQPRPLRTTRRTPAPTGTPPLGEGYHRSPVPSAAFAAAASATSKILQGTGIGLPAQHDPITFAKQIATLDWMANGRFVFGIGFGWN